MNPDKEAPSVIVRRLMREGLSQDEILTQLRTRGYSIIESIKGLKDAAGLSLIDAKRTVHFSPAWADQREQFDAFHELLSDEPNSDPSENSN